MRGITSVEAIKIPANYNSSVALIFLGALIALVGLVRFASLLAVGDISVLLLALGFSVIALGMPLAIRKRPTFVVVLRTAGGELTAYQSYDWNYISQIIEALNQSIISHG